MVQTSASQEYLDGFQALIDGVPTNASHDKPLVYAVDQEVEPEAPTTAVAAEPSAVTIVETTPAPATLPVPAPSPTPAPAIAVAEALPIVVPAKIVAPAPDAEPMALAKELFTAMEKFDPSDHTMEKLLEKTLDQSPVRRLMQMTRLVGYLLTENRQLIAHVQGLLQQLQALNGIGARAGDEIALKVFGDGSPTAALKKMLEDYKPALGVVLRANLTEFNTAVGELKKTAGEEVVRETRDKMLNNSITAISDQTAKIASERASLSIERQQVAARELELDALIAAERRKWYRAWPLFATFLAGVNLALLVTHFVH